MTSNRDKWLEKVRRARDRNELEQIYGAWGQDYEREVMSCGYNMPAIFAGLLGRYVRPQNGPILDVGAGTGILGASLFLLGYKNLVAIDFSEGMLEVARRKGVYRELRQMVLGEYLDFSDRSFVAVTVMGVFGAGHAPLESFDELVRITRRGGHIVFSIRADEYLNQGFKQKQDALEGDGKWRLVEITEAFNSLPLADTELMNHIFVYRIP